MKLNFDHEIELKAENILLRPLKNSDISYLDPIAFNPEIWTYTTLMIDNGQALTYYLDRALEGRSIRQRYPFLIWDLEREVALGSTSYLNYSAYDQRIEIGHTWIVKEYQGAGVNRLCKYLLLQYAFDKLDLYRVEFKIDNLNLQARRAMSKIGATEEGILRSHTLMHDGRRRDTVFYSILSDEWDGIKKRIFQELAYK